MAEDEAVLRTSIAAHPKVVVEVYGRYPLLFYCTGPVELPSDNLKGWVDGLRVYLELGGRMDIKSEDWIKSAGGSLGRLYW